MERKRVFIAINLPEEIKNAIISKQEEIKKIFHSLGKNFDPVRWTKKENLHITIEFLGYLRDKEIEKVGEIIAEVSSNIPPLKITLTNICYVLEKEKIPRMIWVKGEKSDILSKMKINLDKKLEKEIGFKPEKREFTPHITLGRIRKWQFKAIPLEERPEIEKDIDLMFKVSSIELMESKLKPTGAEYFILKSFPLSSK